MGEVLTGGLDRVKRKSVALPSNLTERREMQPSTLLDLSDVQGTPRVKLTLPPLRVGDRVRLAFRVQRNHKGRHEVLDVSGDFRVTASVTTLEHQHLSVESVGKTPSWRAVRKDIAFRRQIPPAIFPPTVL